MKRKIFLPLFFMAIIMWFGSCSSKLQPLSADYIKATPQPLVVEGTDIPVTIDATFPQKWFNKNATVKITPVLRYSGGEAWGTEYTYLGENVAGNGQTIRQDAGGNVTMRSTFKYAPELRKSELYLTFEAKIKNKTVALPDLKIGDGVIATEMLADAGTVTPAIAPDKFQRIIKQAYDANIMFLIQQAELRSSELKKDEVESWKGVVISADQTPNQKVSVEVSAYASPDGGVDLNEKLAAQREKNTNQYLSKELKKEKVDAPVYARYTAQDWEGFKQLVEKSNIQDKNLILQVLSSYTDPEEREKQIKNISSIFSVLAEEILPQLRRSRLTANVEIIGKSDEEISKMAASGPKQLSVEELLYAATLVKTNAEKEAIYKKVTDIYPKDYRGWNNLGVIAYENGKIADAESDFNKSLQLTTQAPETNMNLGLVALLKGNQSKAEQFFGNAAGVPELSAATGLLALQKGDYAKAASALSGEKSNNAALAQILTKDYSKAQSTLNAVSNPDATTAYLKAIVAARTNNLNDVISNLQQSISLDRSKAKEALNDLEFAKYTTNSQFLNLVK